MNFLKRAMTSVTRRPGKSVILLLLVFILGTVISGAIAVDGAVSNTDANLRRNLRPLVTFEQDWQARNEYIEESGLSWEEFPQETLTPSLVREIGALEYVEHFEYSIPVGVQTPDLVEFRFGREDEGMGWVDSGLTHLNLRGTSETELLQVREGVLELVEGRSFTEAELTTVSEVNPVIVSRGFANQNNLSLNSTFEIPVTVNLPHPEGEWMWDPEWDASEESTFAEEIFVFEIIGLVDSAEEVDLEDQSNAGWELRSRAEGALRNLHVPNPVAEAIIQFQSDAWVEMALDLGEELDPWMQMEIQEQQDQEERPVTSVMVLRDALEIDAFRAEAEELLPEFWRIVDLSNAFGDISSSMETLQGIAGWVLWVSVGATLLILSLLITLFLRDRRYEMGVYLALGEKKGRIISQILLEVVVTAVVGITLAVFTGNMISGAMSQNMLRNELIAAQQQQDNSFGMEWNEFSELGFNQEMSIDEMMDAFDVSLNMETIGLFYAVGLGAAIFSTIVPVVYVVTLNPKKVLM